MEQSRCGRIQDEFALPEFQFDHENETEWDGASSMASSTTSPGPMSVATNPALLGLPHISRRV
jgi:hypothetical protein